MRTSSSCRRSLLALMLGLLPTLVLCRTDPALAQSTPEAEKSVRHHKVMIADEGAHRPMRAWSWRFPSAFLGVETVRMTPELRQHFGAERDAGIMISRIGPDSPAETAGLQVGDILTAVEKQSIRDMGDLFDVIGDYSPGDTVNLDVLRNGSRQTIVVTLDERVRPSIDIRSIRLPNLEDLQIEIPEIDTEQLENAYKKLDEMLASPEWKARIEQGLEQHQKHLEEKVRILEERLRELEQQLEKVGS